MNFDYSGTSVVVTGGARGIGAGIARLFADAGADVTVWDLDPATTGWTPRLAVAVDVTSAASVTAAVRETLDAVGRIDVLVASAGITGPTKPAWEYTPEDWRRVIDLDLTGTFLAAQAVIPSMRAAGYGRIVSVASIAGKEATRNLSAYTAAKHGVVGMTKVLARELVTEGITVNAVAPVMVKTDLFDQMTPEFIEATQALIPLGRLVTVDEVASMVAWIASDRCSATTGVTFDVSGGRADY